MYSSSVFKKNPSSFAQTRFSSPFTDVSRPQASFKIKQPSTVLSKNYFSPILNTSYQPLNIKPQKNHKVIVSFDMDGTLVKENKDFKNSFLQSQIEAIRPHLKAILNRAENLGYPLCDQDRQKDVINEMIDKIIDARASYDTRFLSMSAMCRELRPLLQKYFSNIGIDFHSSSPIIQDLLINQFYPAVKHTLDNGARKSILLPGAEDTVKLTHNLLNQISASGSPIVPFMALISNSSQRRVNHILEYTGLRQYFLENFAKGVLQKNVNNRSALRNITKNLDKEKSKEFSKIIDWIQMGIKNPSVLNHAIEKTPEHMRPFFRTILAQMSPYIDLYYDEKPGVRRFEQLLKKIDYNPNRDDLSIIHVGNDKADSKFVDNIKRYMQNTFDKDVDAKPLLLSQESDRFPNVSSKQKHTNQQEVQTSIIKEINRIQNGVESTLR
jgi:phosphoglycolate phosphatase-like HAD superfamily hydrolase